VTAHTPSARDDARTSSYATTAIQKAAPIVGIVFLLVGVAGFIPGLTHGTDHLEAAGADSEAMLLGIFQVSVLHNIVHLLFGVAGLGVAARAAASRHYLIWGGVVYAVLWIYGLFAVGMPDLNVVPVSTADNWLHLGLAVGTIALGLLVGRSRRYARERHSRNSIGRSPQVRTPREGWDGEKPPRPSRSPDISTHAARPSPAPLWPSASPSSGR
jgi:membrane-bound ClpP family serine protease